MEIIKLKLFGNLSNMYIRFIFIPCILLLLNNTYAQNSSSIDYRSVDSITFEAYSNENWEKVLKVGSRAIKNRIDFFYLRMRLGIANYKLGNILPATVHFEKALEFNRYDQDAMIYLYDCYQIIGKKSTARKLWSRFPEKMKEKNKLKNNILAFVDIGGGYTFSNNQSLRDGPVKDDIGDTLSGFEVMVGNKSLIYAGLSFNVLPSVTYFCNVNRLNIEKKTKFQYRTFPLVFDSVSHMNWGIQNHYSVVPEVHITNFSTKLKQTELYQNLEARFENGWGAYLYGNAIFINSSTVYMDSKQETIRKVDYRINGQQPVFFNYSYDSISFVQRDTSFVDYLLGLNIEKDFNSIILNLNGSYGSINGASISQAGVSVTYYLLPDASLWGSTKCAFVDETRPNGYNEARLLLTQKLGARLFKGCWFSVDFTYGNLQNTNLDNGFIVYNDIDNIKYSSGAQMKYFINNHICFHLNYNFVSYEGAFVNFSPTENSYSTIPRYYQTNKLTGGLTWIY